MSRVVYYVSGISCGTNVIADQVRGLISLLLPSSSMSLYRSPSGGHVQITLSAGMQDAAYLEEKAGEFRKHWPTDAQLRIFRSGQQARTGVRFRVSSRDFVPLYNLLYPRRRRSITSSALELCGGRALAWYWCDWLAPFEEGTCLLSHVGTTNEEAEMVAQWMYTILGVESTYRPNPRPPHFPCLQIAADQVDKGARLLLDYCPTTRRSWMEGFLLDDDRVHEQSALLLPGERDPRPERPEASPLAGACPLRDGDGLPAPSSSDPEASRCQPCSG